MLSETSIFAYSVLLGGKYTGKEGISSSSLEIYQFQYLKSILNEESLIMHFYRIKKKSNISTLLKQENKDPHRKRIELIKHSILHSIVYMFTYINLYHYFIILREIGLCCVGDKTRD